MLIERLTDPDARRWALLEVQHYHNRPGTPEAHRMSQQWQEIVQRKDVQKAIARVGRVLDVALPR